MAKATFAAGCFWGVQDIFQSLDGVAGTKVGYIGGASEKPTYEQVCTGRTDHAEAVEIEFDPATITYDELLTYFFKLHDPTTMNRQGPDIGTQYRSAIFYHDESQKESAQKSVDRLTAEKRFSRPIVTQVVPEAPFWDAEEYHQHYFKKRGIANTCHVF